MHISFFIIYFSTGANHQTIYSVAKLDAFFFKIGTSFGTIVSTMVTPVPAEKKESSDTSCTLAHRTGGYL